MNTIYETTPLIPEIIAEKIVFSAQQIFPVDGKKLLTHLCEKAETVFQNNKRFRRPKKFQPKKIFGIGLELSNCLSILFV